MKQKKFQLLREMHDPEIEVLTETVGEEGNEKEVLKFRGPFTRCDCRNKNKRFYPYDVMKPSVKKYTEERIANRRSYSELGHPEGIEIHMERVSHLVTNFTWEDKVCIGEAEVFEELPMGKILYGVLMRECSIGVSTRGLGDLTEVAEGYNVKDYEMVAVDVVDDPSTPDAFVDSINESKTYICEYYGDNRRKFRRVDEAYDTLDARLSRLPSHDRNRAVRAAMKEFLNSV